jgi:hypothetical protein
MASSKRIAFTLACAGALGACSSLPSPKISKHKFPEKDAYVGEVKRAYKTLGVVRAKVDFPTLDPTNPDLDESKLCKNYYNKAVTDLLNAAHDKGADAVVDVKSVVFYEDGRHETYPTPECSDEGDEGQILAQGIAVKWTEPDPKASPVPARKGKQGRRRAK